MDQFLNKQSSEGDHHSEGCFTLDATLARRKQVAFQLAEPGAYLLKFVQAAVAAEASSLAVTVHRDELNLRINGKHPDLNQIDHLAKALVQLPSQRSSLRHLAVGLNAACHASPLEILWKTPNGTLGITQDSVRRLDSTNAVPQLWLKKPRRLIHWFRSNFFINEITELTRACRYVPLDITLDGRPLYRPCVSRISGLIPDELGLSRPHLLYELVLPQARGLRVYYPVDLYEHSWSDMSLWRGSLPEGFGFTPEAIPLLIDGWHGTSTKVEAEAVIGVPPSGRGFAEIVPILDGVCLTPLRRGDLGLQGLRVLLDASDLNTDLSEFSLIEDDNLALKLKRIKNLLARSTQRLTPHVQREALQRAGVESERLKPLLEQTLKLLDFSQSRELSVAELVPTLLSNSKVRLAPNISKKQLANSRKIHARYLPEDEPILALHDDTLLGSGKEGFVITEHRICWKATFDKGNYLLWSELPYCEAAKLLPGCLQIGGTEISVFSTHEDIASPLFDLLGAITQLALEPIHSYSPEQWKILSVGLATLGRHSLLSYYPYHSPAWSAKLVSIYKEFWVEGEPP